MNNEFTDLDLHEQAMVRNIDGGTSDGDGCGEGKLDGSRQS